MRNLLLPILCIAISLFGANAAFAQPGNTNCGTCTFDDTCPAQFPLGGLCPGIVPEATVGEAYSEAITFYLPVTISVTEPVATDVTLHEVFIQDLIGLPTGLEWSCNSPDCIYQPLSENDTLGCVTICGTPNVAPGEYIVTIDLLADVEVSILPGQILENQTLPEPYTVTLVVLPPEVGFNYDNFSACGELSNNFEAIQDFNPEQPTSWEWDFGDGNTTTGKTASYTHTAPGTYDVILTTTVQNYVVTEVCVEEISGGYCGDIEEPLCNCGTPIIGACPDPYATLLGLTLPTQEGVEDACWTGLSYTLLGTSFDITVMDEDNGPPLGTQDDELGVFSIMVNNGAGSYPFSNGNLSGTVTVDLVLANTLVDTLTVNVYEIPPAPVITQDEEDLVISNNNGYDIVWVNPDGDTLAATTATFTPADGNGDYSATFVSEDGCASETSMFNYVAVGVDNLLEGATLLSLYPNPSQGMVNLKLDFTQTTEVEIRISDALGRLVRQEQRIVQNGEEHFQWDASTWETGVYFVQVRLANGSQMTQRLTVL